MVDDVEQQHKKDLISYSARRTFLATMVAHLAVFVFTTFLVYTTAPSLSSELFSWHPFLMTLGFVLFMTEAILMFSQQSSFTRGDRKLQVRAHWILQSLMVICSLAGFIVIYVFKESRNKHHATTWHGLLGYVTMISCVLQAFAGISLLYPSLITNFVSLGQAKIYHATYGLFNYTLVTIVLNLGLWSNWANAYITGFSWFMCVACIDVLALVIMTQVTNHYLPRLRAQRQ